MLPYIVVDFSHHTHLSFPIPSADCFRFADFMRSLASTQPKSLSFPFPSNAAALKQSTLQLCNGLRIAFTTLESTHQRPLALTWLNRQQAN